MLRKTKILIETGCQLLSADDCCLLSVEKKRKMRDFSLFEEEFGLEVADQSSMSIHWVNAR